MDHIGIDVHKRESQIYIVAEGGELIEQRSERNPSASRPCSAVDRGHGS